MKSIERIIQSYTDNQTVLGGAVALLKAGEIIYSGGFGLASVEDLGSAITPGTLFAYGSICKTICATLVMRLAEQDLLHLDTLVVQNILCYNFYEKSILFIHQVV